MILLPKLTLEKFYSSINKIYYRPYFSIMENVVLVDELDNEIGLMEKIEAHKKGLLHRAFSIFIFNDKQELLLQQRALSKYHSAGLWSNTCCSHPRKNEQVLAAAERRLQEELGFKTKLKQAFTFIYKAEFDNGLTEHEFDYVFVGNYQATIIPNKEEVENYVYQSVENIEQDFLHYPKKYTPWFLIALPKIKEWLAQNTIVNAA